MIKAIIFSLLVSLCIAQPCTTSSPLCVGEGAACGTAGICNYGLTCLLNATTYKQQCFNVSAFTYNQTCTSFTGSDCPVAFGYASCTGGVCVQKVNPWLYVGENCGSNAACYSSNCTGGVCVEASASCTGSNQCGYGRYCNLTAYPFSCVPKGAAGSACKYDDQCPDLMTCQNGACAELFTGNAGDACTSSSQCSGCLGCNVTSYSPSVTGTCAAVGPAVWDVPCVNSTDTTTCTVGLKICACNSTQGYSCLDYAAVTTNGQCVTQWQALETCINTNQCAAVSNSMSKFSTALYASPVSSLSSNSCLLASCSAQLSCLLNCQVVASGVNNNLQCGTPAYNFACASPNVQCQVSPSTGGGSTGAATSTGGSSNSTSGGASTSGAATGTSGGASTSGAATNSSTGGSSNTTSGSPSASSTPASQSGTPSSTSFGFVLIAPFMSLIAALFI